MLWRHFYILVLWPHFETKILASNRTCLCWGTTSRPRQRQQSVHLSAGAPLLGHRQQIVHLSAGAPLRDKDTQNKSYIFMLGITPRPRHRQQMVYVSAGAPLRDQDTGNKPRHRQQIPHFRIGPPLQDQDTGNKSYIFVLGHHFETKTPATNRAS